MIICITHTHLLRWAWYSDISLRRYRTEDLGGTIIVRFYIQFIFVHIFVNRQAFDQMFQSLLIPRALEIEFY